MTSVFVPAGKYYGRKTGQQAEIIKYLHIYERLEHSAHPICLEGETVVLASKVVVPAS